MLVTALLDNISHCAAEDMLLQCCPVCQMSVFMLCSSVTG